MTDTDASTYTPDQLRARITLVAALRDGAKTPAEAATAKRMITRLEARLADAAAQDDTCEAFEWYGTRCHGSRYEGTAGLSAAEIAKLIRQDIALHRKAGQLAVKAGAVALPDPIADAPAAIRFSVRSYADSYHSSIKVDISGIPEAWGFCDREIDGMWYRHVATDALDELAQAVEAIRNSYNYDGSDTQTDYFDRRFYGGVGAGYTSLA